MDALGRLAGGIAHDFNNLLTGIRGYGDLLLEQLPEHSAAREAADHIRRATVRAASLTSQLLAFTRRQSIETRVIALDDLVRQLGALLRRIIGDDVTLALRLESERARVRVDPGQIEQVILNLAVNARDAMPRGGQLTISTARATDGAGRREVRLTVADTGSGMTEEVRARIFEPFFTTKEVGKGTGLGLAIVHGIIEQVGGAISVETAPGVGSSFYVSLPEVDEPSAQPTASDPKRAPAPQGNETILLAEDNEEVRDFVQFVLKRAGYQVLIAEDGVRALEEAAAHPREIQLLLSDVVMPRMSGGELAERLARARPTIKVLHMSGHPGPAGLVGGADPDDPRARLAFVQKPFSADELLRRVRATLDAPAP
jgi:CheY-like chemotaxis protein